MIAPRKLIQRGDDSRKNWPHINGNFELLRELDRRLAPIEAELARRFQIVGGSLRTLRVKEVPSESEYLVCRTWDGTTEGEDDIIVAKPHDARQPASQTLGGVTYTYTYAATTLDTFNDFRVSDDGDTTESQLVTPVWFENCLILVARVNYSGVLFDDTINPPYDLQYIEVSSRCWAKVEEPPA